MIIGVSGKMGVGKTTLANVARDSFDFEVRSFAGELKREVTQWLIDNNIPFRYSQLYGSQEEKASLLVVPIEAITYEMRKHGFLEYNRIHGVFEAPTSGRLIMQWWGSEFRRIQNPNYWVEKMLKDVDEDKLTIIDDVRYLNEAEMVKVCNGELIRVNRYTECPDRAKADHISEVALDNYNQFKVTIDNNNITLDQYRELCHESLKYILQTVV